MSLWRAVQRQGSLPLGREQTHDAIGPRELLARGGR